MNPPYFTRDIEYEDEFVEKTTWYQLAGMALFIIFFIVLFTVSDFIVWVIRQLTKDHVREVILCLVFSLIVSAFVIVSLLYWARYAFA